MSVERLREALFQCYVLSGADTDGARSLAEMGQRTPDIDVLAVRAVRELRESYDECLDELP